MSVYNHTITPMTHTLCGFFKANATAELHCRLPDSECVDDVTLWMRANRLQLNVAKMEVIWCSSSRHQHQIPVATESAMVIPVRSVRDPDICRLQCLDVVWCCQYRIELFRRPTLYSQHSSVSHQASSLLHSLVVSLVLTTLRQRNSFMSGSTIKPLLLILCDVPWLRAPQRIDCCLTVLAFRCQHGMAPSYLLSELRRVSDVVSRRRLRSSTTALVVSRTKRSTIGDLWVSSSGRTRLEHSFAGCHPVIFAV